MTPDPRIAAFLKALDETQLTAERHRQRPERAELAVDGGDRRIGHRQITPVT